MLPLVRENVMKNCEQIFKEKERIEDKQRMQTFFYDVCKENE